MAFAGRRHIWKGTCRISANKSCITNCNAKDTDGMLLNALVMADGPRTSGVRMTWKKTGWSRICTNAGSYTIQIMSIWRLNSLPDDMPRPMWQCTDYDWLPLHVPCNVQERN